MFIPVEVESISCRTAIFVDIESKWICLGANGEVVVLGVGGVVVPILQVYSEGQAAPPVGHVIQALRPPPVARA